MKRRSRTTLKLLPLQPLSLTPKVILFDLGGVVVRWVGIQALSDLTGLSTLQVSERFKHSEIGNRFERGHCSNEDFIAEFRSLFDLTGSDAELIKLWNGWVQDPYDGIIETIKNLKTRYRVACLSNTNDLHWEHLKAYLDLDALFDRPYASHKIHRAKPDPDCFEFVIRELNVKPEEIIFLDDSQTNIDAALNIGMQAHKVDPTFGAVPTLKSLGLV